MLFQAIQKTPKGGEKNMKNNKKGFTLIELLVVIAIIGLLATLSVVALNTARVKARDARRVSDVKQMQTALEMYFDSNNGSYPAASGSMPTSTFISSMPTNPSPRTDNGCPDSDYVYKSVAGTGTYTISYCLSAGGAATATPAGIK